MYVVLSNDDGITSPGLRALYDALKANGNEVLAVGPMHQKSGASHSLTVFEPLRCSQIGEDSFEGIGIYGTPADCVRLALGSLAKKPPDLVISGINMGPNAGPDILYSGTVAAAAEGANAGIPSVAISHSNHFGSGDLNEIAAHALSLVDCLDWSRLPPGRVINVNYPDVPAGQWKGARVCRQSPAVWTNVYNERKDPRGFPYWWMEGEIDEANLGEDSDRYLLAQGFITITPLKFDYTDSQSAAILKDMGLEENG